MLFGIGDCAFLVAVSIAATATMHHAHDRIASFPIAMLIGMIAAMLVQTIMALLVAPLLGSIESMVPSMVVAMISPMSVCGLHLVGLEPPASACVVLGAAFGAAMFASVVAYGVRCRRLLNRRVGEIP